MGDKRLAGSKFWLLGAAWWIVFAVVVAALLRFWPHLMNSQPFFIAVILGAVVGGFAIVYLFQSRGDEQ
jgi:hypothetical protein